MRDPIAYLTDIARDDDDIRGAILYGSRADADIPPDPYQDFDVYFITMDPERFDISVFTDVCLSFIPSEVYPDLFPGEICHLMLFGDDTRIDLTLGTLETYRETHARVGPRKILLDKDGALAELPEPDPGETRVRPMDARTFAHTCAEFFWETQNMVKGLLREELSYAMFIRDVSMRDMLHRMVDTAIGLRTGFAVSVGSLGRFRKHYLTKEEYARYRATYAANTEEDVWESLFVMLAMFGCLGRQVAAQCHYSYPEEDETFIRSYLERMRGKR